MAVDSKFQCMDIDVKIKKFTWRIQNFSSLEVKKLYSEVFTVDGYKWRVLIFPKGNNVDHLSIYLDVADSATLPYGWTKYAQVGLGVIDQFDRETSSTKVTHHCFNARQVDWGFTSFLRLTELHDPKRGYLLNDACLVEVYVCTDKTLDFISHEFIVKTDWDELKAKEADCVKAVIDNQKTPTTKPVEITPPSPTQSSSQTVAIEPEESAEEDMNTFFTSLESELSSSRIVYSKEEAKEALAKINEALNTTPVNLNDSGKFSPLKQAFMILASFDGSSTTLTIDQKNELLGLDERLKELANRAAKAVQDKDQLTAKESMKRTMTCNLESSLIRYKEVETEVKQVDQTLAALREEVEEAQKRKEKMLAERKGIYRSCKEMKMELDALGKELAECEATAKVGEEEEKSVEAEWGRIKDFISSIEAKI
ncbi:MATH domain and coiled-coil domain-containing protein At3g58270 isoform X3 [Gossypium raimondii]|uniref:MATH domain and coiled-coil domain-containing protein At3g58270 isoform X3 n=1 Tax=Gossypium raimondii TaxID=29730 RepID=UPI00227C461C|nr:MATH domain and coiled-coil domain-containing protein At3g58270 isoform X3 [Gossypium raimondii]